MKYKTKDIWTATALFTQGYNPQAKFCFGSKFEAKLYVAYYLEKNCEGMTLKQALCYWNTGKATPSCAYSDGAN